MNDADTIKCLIMTDNHVGFLERDAVRGDDSFRAFEECLQIAQREKVDCILHGGDLFHHNKPSRKCLYRVMELLKKYCFGSAAVELELLTQAADNFTTETVNYMDPNLNVEIPIFAIHGNHDDPAGDGAFSALDLLANARLLNYFGKHQQVDQLSVTPVVLRKGASRMALYGLGNVRDERLYRAFAEKRVTMLQPPASGNGEEEDDDDIFSIMLIHQNRVQHSAKNFVTELMLPEFLDLVVWGHEHECLVTPQQSAGREFFVSQPGSSVATSLSEGESKEKNVAILEINKGQFQLRPVPLTSVRPFVIEDINLSVENVPKDSKGMHKALVARVCDMIATGLAQNAEMIPLIRLRIELSSGYEKISPQRFGAEFVGRVANPDDMLHYLKKKVRSDVTDKNARSEASILAARTAQTAGAKQTVEAEVGRILASRVKHMQVLPQRHLSEALNNFVEKEDGKAFASFLEDSMKEVRAHVMSRLKENGIRDVSADLVKSYSEERVKEEDERDEAPVYDVVDMGAAGKADDEDEEDDDDKEAVLPTQKAKRVKREPEPAPVAKKKRTTKKKIEIVIDDDDEDDDDEDEEEVIKPKPKRGKAVSTNAKKTSRAVKRERDYEEEEDDEDEDEDDEEDDKEAVLSSASRKKVVPAKNAAPRKARKSAGASQSTIGSVTQAYDDDELLKPLNLLKKKKR